MDQIQIPEQSKMIPDGRLHDLKNRFGIKFVQLLILIVGFCSHSSDNDDPVIGLVRFRTNVYWQ
jgi:hypothetical protein